MANMFATILDQIWPIRSSTLACTNQYNSYVERTFVAFESKFPISTCNEFISMNEAKNCFANTNQKV